MRLQSHRVILFVWSAEGVHALLQLAVAHWEAGKAADAAPLLMRGLRIVQDHQQHTRGGRPVDTSSRPITVCPLPARLSPARHSPVCLRAFVMQV